MGDAGRARVCVCVCVCVRQRDCVTQIETQIETHSYKCVVNG